MAIDTYSRLLTSKINSKLTTMYDDLPPVPLITSRVGSIAPTLTTFNGNIEQYTFGINDEIYGTNEITHDYIEGTDLHPHIHWATNGSDVDNRYIKWELEYSYGNHDGVFTTPIIIVDEELIPADTPDKTHFVTDFNLIDGTNILVGAYICWRLRRITASGTAPTSNPFGLAIGVHAEMNMLK